MRFGRTVTPRKLLCFYPLIIVVFLVLHACAAKVRYFSYQFQVDPGHRGFLPTTASLTKELWTASISGGLDGPPTFHEGKILIKDGLNRLLIIAPSDGSIERVLPLPGNVTTPFVGTADGSIYFGNLSGLRSIAHNGKKIDCRLDINGGLTLAPSIEPNLYILTSKERIYAIDRQTCSQLWRTAIDRQIMKIAQHPGKIIYLATDTHILALEKKSGKLLWRLEMKNRIAGLIADGTIVYVTSGDSLIALDGASGEEKYAIDLPAPASANPLIDTGILYLTAGNHVLATEPESGEIKWQTELGDRTDTIAPLFYEGILIVGTETGSLAALNHIDGKIIWQTAGEGFRFHPLLVDRGIVFAGSQGGTLKAYTCYSGKNLFNLAPPKPLPGTIIDAEKTLIFSLTQESANQQRTIFNLDRTNGKIVTTLISSSNGHQAIPAYRHGVLYTLQDENLCAFDLTLQECRWSIKIKDNLVLYPLLLIPDRLILTSEKRIEAYDLKDGETLWSFDTATPISTPPSETSGLILVTERSGTLQTVRADNGKREWKSEKLIHVSKPCVASGPYFFCIDEAGSLFGATIADGTQTWSFDDLGRKAVHLILDDDALFFFDSSGNLTRIERAKGTRIWKIHFGSAQLAPAISNEEVFLALTNGTIVVIDKVTGMERKRLIGDSRPTLLGLTSDSIVIGTENGKLRAYR